MGLSSAGIGSNLPIDSIISQLMTVEQKPLTVLDSKVSSYQSKLSAIGTLKSAMATFQSAAKGLADISKFQAVSAKVGDAAVASASAGSRAAVGNYSLEVTQLAQAQKLVAAGRASATEPVGAGTITIETGTISGGSFDAASGKYTGAKFDAGGTAAKQIKIDPNNNSLTGIRDAINKAGAGVTASIVNDGGATPYRLVLTETATGKASSMKISVDGDDALKNLLGHDPAGVQGMRETVSAKNAEFTLDGIAVSSATNSPADVLEGVTLTLAKTNAGNPTTVSVVRDTETVTASVGKFVSAYNAISKTLDDLTSYNAATKKGAVLNGDSTVRNMRTELRAMLAAPIANGGAFSTLSEIGVTVKAGVMAVDDAKLKKAIENSPADIASLFAANGKPSDSLVGYKSAGAKTQPGDYAVVVTQAAARGSASATSAFAPLTVDDAENSFTLTLDGVSADVKLASGSYDTPEALAAELQSKINGTAAFSSAGSAVTVSVTDGKLSISSNRWGANSNVTLSPGGLADSLLGSEPEVVAGANVAGTIGGVAAVGSGRVLTGGVGSPAEGLTLQVDGAAGNRGTVNYAQGYASQFEKFASGLLDSASGALALRTDGINASLKDLASARERLNTRLADTEERYRKQYTALDTMISNMNATSSYLTQQLAALSSLG